MAIARLGRVEPPLGGLIAAISPLWMLGFAAVVLAAGRAVALGRRGATIWVVLVAAVLTVTPVLAYNGVKSQSTEKHVQMIQSIQETGVLYTRVDAYHGWPAFFSSLAVVGDTAQLADPLTLALVWPVLNWLLRLLVLGALFRRLVGARRTPLALLLVVLTDSIGQDYFSPQSLAFVLAFALVAVLPDIRGWGTAAAVVLGAAGLAMGHQLTPYILIGVVFLLVVVGRFAPRWTFLLLAVPTAVWGFLQRKVVESHVSLADMFDLFNLRPPVTVSTTGLERLPIVGLASKSLALGILVIAALAALGWWQHRRNRLAWAVVACPGVGLFLGLLASYGNESIFRAASFGIPWLAVWATMARVPMVRASVFWPLVALALAPLIVLSSFLMDGSSIQRATDTAGFRYYQGIVRADSSPTFMLLGPGDMPIADSVWNTKSSVLPWADVAPGFRGIFDTSVPAPERVAEVTRRAGYFADTYGPTSKVFASFSPATRNYVASYGIQSADDFDRIERAWGQSPCWTPVFEEGQTLLYQMVRGCQP